MVVLGVGLEIPSRDVIANRLEMFCDGNLEESEYQLRFCLRDCQVEYKPCGITSLLQLKEFVHTDKLVLYKCSSPLSSTYHGNG